MDLMAEVRPELHRYCARMTGSVFDGEDIVQETLAKALLRTFEKWDRTARPFAPGSFTSRTTPP